jgi:tetratricopeptide (TPR) repeat protein
MDGRVERSARGRSRESELVPSQLPVATAKFTGRREALHELNGLLGLERGGTLPPVVITAIDGTAGVGKTELALFWAHRMKDRFPDGQLYINLRGYGPGTPMRPTECLTDFFIALGVTAETIPASLEAQAALYRSLLSGRRMLIVLDNANSSDQVRPLLPGSATCMAIVTSRNRLDSLAIREGAHRITLDLLPLNDAIALLGMVLGPARIAAEPEAAAELARQCACLPLALRIAAVRVQNHPHTSLIVQVQSFRGHGRLLNNLSAEDHPEDSIKTVFSWSCHALKPSAARAFRLLGLHPGGDIGLGVAAAALAAIPASAQRILDILVANHLIKQTAHDRYHFHDLLRDYAVESAEDNLALDEQRAALRRILDWYLHTADSAERHLTPHRQRVALDPPADGVTPLPITSYKQALEWCDLERFNLLAVIQAAEQANLDHYAYLIARLLWGFYSLRKHWTDWIATHIMALAAVRRLGNSAAEGRLLNSLGLAHREQRKLHEAVAYHEEALTIFRHMDERYGVAITLNELGLAYIQLERLADALRCHEQAIQLTRDIGDRFREAEALNNLGLVYVEMREFQLASACFQGALGIHRDLEGQHGEAVALANLGNANRGLGLLNESLDCFHKALVIHRQLQNRHGEAVTLTSLGDACRESSQFDEAATSQSCAAEIFADLNDRWQEAETIVKLADTFLALGNVASAKGCLANAARIFRELGDPRADALNAQISSLEGSHGE